MFNIEEAIISFLASEGFDAYADVPEVAQRAYLWTIQRLLFNAGQHHGLSLLCLH